MQIVWNLEVPENITAGMLYMVYIENNEKQAGKKKNIVAFSSLPQTFKVLTNYKSSILECNDEILGIDDR